MSVRFGLLGDIEAHVDARPLYLGHVRQRFVLAVLLVDVNRSVSIERFAERVWAGRPPHRVRRLLATYVSRLRRALAGTGADIGRECGGYVVRVSQDAIDLYRFRDLVARARADQSLALFDEALGLWRGDAFAGVDTPWCNAMRQTLDAERLAAELDRIDVALRVGEHNAVLAEVSARAAAHPLDERMAGQLMLALYRAGRQADALAHYGWTRRLLAAELGADPGPALRELHQRILTSTTEPSTSRELAVPRQLPATHRCFIGRERELAALTEAVDVPARAMTVSVLSGPGGIGKTSLALRWAHGNADRFPDGQLYVNLRGFDSSASPTPPAVAVRGFLDALRVAPAAVPGDEDDQISLYRSLVAGKRLLVVLDNARDAAQVEPLLPGSETCAVLVTSRDRLVGLGVRGARLLELDVLTDSAARELLTGRIGAQRVAEEPAAVAELVHWCGGLPLALGIVASRAATRPGFALAVLAEELRDASRRLDVLDAGDMVANLRAVFSWSHRALDPAAAWAVQLLGSAPGPDIGEPAAASLTGLDAARVRVLLRELVDVHLLREHVPGRYRMHDLLRLYVSELPDDGSREVAAARLADFYLHAAHAAARVLRPEHTPVDLDPPEPGCAPLSFADRVSAAAWFDAEHACLLAALDAAVERGAHASVWKLAWCLGAFHVPRGRLREDLAAWRAGVASARRLDDPVPGAVAAMFLGTACARVGDLAGAVDHLREAFALAERAGAVPVLADVHRAFGWVRQLEGDLEQALRCTRQALRLYRAAGNAMREADALNSIGWLHARLGHHRHADVCCGRALAVCRVLGHRRGEIVTLDSLGYIAGQLGEHARALGYYKEALDLARDTENAYDEAGILANLGETEHALGHHGEARRTRQRAMDLYLAQHRVRDAESVS